MTAGDHFERVAVVYESLRITDEAPVRRIGQLLPGRPVTGLDIGCGTGRYTRLLRGLLPDGSLLVAAGVSAAMLAQLRAASRGHARGVVPLLAAGEELPLRTASLDLVTAFNCVHHRTPQQNARTIWCRYFPGFTGHEQRLHNEAAIRDAVRWTDGLTMVATQTFRHPRTSTAERLGAQARGRHYSTFSSFTPQELRAAIATFLARLSSPEVSWVDEHLLVIAGGSRHNQVEPDRPASLANPAIKEQALQISAGRVGEAPKRHPRGKGAAGCPRRRRAGRRGAGRAGTTAAGDRPGRGLADGRAGLVGSAEHRRVGRLEHHVHRREHACRVAIGSQSGGLGLFGHAAAQLGVSMFVSVGDGADVSAGDLLEWCEQDERTAAVMLYVETFGNPGHFTRIARRVSRKKPIGAFCGGDREVLEPVFSAILNWDEYLVIAGYRSYVDCHDRAVGPAWADEDRWTRMSILNTARSGFFSCDRTVGDYCRDRWHPARACTLT